MLKEYVSVDLEMSGLSPREDRIIEIGAVRVIDGAIVDKYSVLVNPHRKLDPHIKEITGLTDEDLEDGIEDREAVKEFLLFANGLPLIGHHIVSDIGFLKTCAVNNKEKMKNLAVDTLGISRKVLPLVSKRSLDSLCQYAGIERGTSHRALDDAIATHQLFQWMMKLPEAREEWFKPRELNYKVKKQSPITKAQAEQLKRLLDYNELELDIEIGSLTKNEASRKIDKILFTYGRIPKA